MSSRSSRPIEEDSLSSFAGRSSGTTSTARSSGSSSSSQSHSGNSQRGSGSLSSNSVSSSSRPASRDSQSTPSAYASTSSGSSSRPSSRDSSSRGAIHPPSPTSGSGTNRRPSLGEVQVQSQFAGLGIAGRDELPVVLQEARQVDRQVETLRRQAAGLLATPAQAAATAGALPQNVTDAIELLNQAIALQPLTDGVYEDKARVLAQSYAMDDALQVISRWLKLKPHCRVAYHRQLQILTHKGLWKEVIASALKGLELYPTDPVLTQLLGNALQKHPKDSPLPAELDSVLGLSKLYRQLFQSVSANSETPSARFGHTACVSPSGVTYIFGGEGVREDSEAVELSNELFTLTPSSSSSSSFTFASVTPVARATSQSPCPRTQHAACFVGNVMYVYGGRDQSGVSLGDLWTFDCTRGEWKQIPIKGGDSPPPVCGHSLTKWKKKLVLFGGAESAMAVNNSLHIFDLDTQIWTRTAASGAKPFARAGHSATLLPGSNELLVVGGWNGSRFKCFFDDVSILNLDDVTWTQPKLGKKSCVFDARAYHATALLADPQTPNEVALFIAGGLGKNGTRLQDIKVLSLDSLTFTQPRIFGSLPVALDGFTMTAIPNGSATPSTAVLIGGQTEQGPVDSFTIFHLNKAIAAGGNPSSKPSSGSSSAVVPLEKPRHNLAPLTPVQGHPSSPSSTPKRLTPLQPLGGSAISFEKTPLTAKSPLR